MSRLVKAVISAVAALGLLFSGIVPASAAMPSQIFDDPIDSAGISDIVEVQVDGYDQRPGRLFVYLTYDSIVRDWHFESDVWTAVTFDFDGDDEADYIIPSGYETLSSTGQTVPVRNYSDFSLTGCTATFFGFPIDEEYYVGWNIDAECVDFPEVFGVLGYVSDSRDETFDFAPDFGFYEVQNPVSVGLPELSITSKPRITGTPTPGSVLTAVPGTWNSGVSFAYQWYAGDDPITGATGRNYIPDSFDVGWEISVEVIGSKSGYASTTLASDSVLIKRPVITLSSVPTITGATKAGSTLTAKPGAWSAGVTFSYQWYRNGAKIAGATKVTYKLASADKGKKITVAVTGKKAGCLNVVKTSAAKTISR